MPVAQTQSTGNAHWSPNVTSVTQFIVGEGKVSPTRLTDAIAGRPRLDWRGSLAMTAAHAIIRPQQCHTSPRAILTFTKVSRQSSGGAVGFVEKQLVAHCE